MALAHPVKLVLKSTTTQTLSDRFTEMMRNKSPGTQKNRERAREENIAQSRASAKNRRLAEQMSNRRDVDQFENSNGNGATAGGGDTTNNVKNRLDQSRVNNRGNVRERLGGTNNTNASVQTRLGTNRGGGATRPRGRSLSRGRLDNGNAPAPRGGGSARARVTRASPRRGGNTGGFNRSTSQPQQQPQRVGRFQAGGRGRGRGGAAGGGGFGDRGNNRNTFTRGRSRSRGRGSGGRGGRGGGGRFADRGDLDNELDSYMSNM